MYLKGYIFEEICKALISAFPNQDKLEQMLRFKCDNNLDIQGDSLFSIVFKVVKDFESRNKLIELIEGACQANPTNSDLNKVYEQIKVIYAPSINNHLFNLFNQELTAILTKLDFAICRIACYKTLPDLRLNLPNFYIKDIDSLKYLFLQEYTDLLSDGTLPLLKFAHILACEQTLEESIRNQLQEWVYSTVNKYKLNYPTFSESELPQILCSYLLIIIKPENNNQYRINAYLIPNEEDKYSVEPIDMEEGEKGILCTFDKIPEKIPEFINKSEKIIIDKTTRPWDLTIEFFLPIAHINEKVEQWKYSYNDDLDDSLIGEKCRVVVRSSDRLQRGDWIRALRCGIDRLKNIRTELNDQIIKNGFVHLTELNSLKWKTLKNTLERDKIGLKLSCPPPPVFDAKYTELFKAILISGIPIAIWTRSNSIPNMDLSDVEVFNHFLNINSLNNCNNLFEILLKERKSAYQEEQCENYLAYHLGLLCEEPNLEEFPDLKAAIVNL